RVPGFVAGVVDDVAQLAGLADVEGIAVAEAVFACPVRVDVVVVGDRFDEGKRRLQGAIRGTPVMVAHGVPITIAEPTRNGRRGGSRRRRGPRGSTAWPASAGRCRFP